ncbi:type I-E CRISPR-associated protein Cas6/Cse3/CasE [Plasticicumulans acidivorans]|uniref:CRISPR system Cascade subunit CasE n=1 Tax=Plasticicumulans acidivorans TaxID=886464 RepID=A0A317N0A8_9GAMM|nr:type I-E CRISPR-associated protein Cas6/Cse3/CasE [Plasticicumulans acidivorans]PWV65550.1 CRISPR system Cascade subunit CasE [Plasticicumulans acidivorans]
MSAYFSQVEWQPQQGDAPALRRLLAGGGYGLHQAMWQLFERTEPPAHRDFLYHRLADGRLAFYVVSARAPRSDVAGWRVRSKPYLPQLRVGERLGFTLRANPTVARGREADGKGRAVRHDVVMDARRSLPEAGEAERVARAGSQWLNGRDGQRAAEHGFALDSVIADAYTQHRLHKPGAPRAITFSTLDYRGVLRVTDAERLQHALLHGIGPAKGFGCGLLLVRRL